MRLFLFVGALVALTSQPVFAARYVGTTPRATCMQGDQFFDTDDQVDGALLCCYATNTWKKCDGARADDTNTGNPSSTSEQVIGRVTIPAGALSVDSVIKVRFWVQTGTIASTTFTLKVKIGSTIIATTGTGTVYSNYIYHGDLAAVVATTGAGGTFNSSGYFMVESGTSNNNSQTVLASIKSAQVLAGAVNTTGAVNVDLTVQWGGTGRYAYNRLFVVEYN